MLVTHTAQGKLFRGLAAISTATALSIVVNAAISMTMPLALNVNGYAYWQLFSLYSSLVGFFALGFNDGIYQRFANSEFTKELAATLASLKWVVVLLGCSGALTTAFLSRVFPEDKHFALIATALCVSFYGTNGFLTYTNQLASRFYIVAISTLIERCSLLAATVVLVASRCQDYRWFVFASICASALRLAFLVTLTPSVSFGTGAGAGALHAHVVPAFKTGFPIMLAVLMGGSILVPSRLVVETLLGPETFSLYSFALTVVFITGTVLTSLSQSAFPSLSRMTSTRRNAYIVKAHAGLTVLAGPLLASFFVAAALVGVAYPHFAGSLPYLGMLFPLFIFQTKYLVLLTSLHRAEGRVLLMVVVAGTGLLANLGASALVGFLTGSGVLIAASALIIYVAWLTIWWLRTARDLGFGWQHADTLELVISAGFLASITAPRLVGLPPGWGLIAACALYFCFLGLLGLREWLWVKREVGEDLSRLVGFSKRLVMRISKRSK